jgi:hypothetical protein
MQEWRARKKTSRFLILRVLLPGFQWQIAPQGVELIPAFPVYDILQWLALQITREVFTE